MRINLLTEFYDQPSDERRRELVETLNRNIADQNIDEVVLLRESDVAMDGIRVDAKVQIVEIPHRPDFRFYFEFINRTHRPDNIYVISNLDIYFDDSILKLNEIDWRDTFVCLSRWNLDGYPAERGKQERGVELQCNPYDSHDSWITVDPVSTALVEMAGVKLGVPGCDGKICHHMQSTGYRTINPCYDIRSYHNHLTGGIGGHRTYKENERLPLPYGEVPPTRLDGSRFVERP